MALNIKNPEAFRLAHEVAEMTGETITGAVTTSLRERLGRLRAEDGDIADRLLVIGRDTASRLPLDVRTADHAELLYDESGLPR